MSNELPYIVALDIGVSHVTALVARTPQPDQPLEIVGMGKVANRGMNRLGIENMELMVAAIKQAVAMAEDMADCRIHSAWVSIPSPNLRSVNASGRIAHQGPITNTELATVLQQAKSQHLLADHYLINSVPLGMILDQQDQWVTNARGMTLQHQLEGHYHLMMLPLSYMQNLDRAVRTAGLIVERMTINILATSEVALVGQEQTGGVCLIDIGASMTQLAVYLEERLILSHTIMMGGQDVTHDIALLLKISDAEAEELKLTYSGVREEAVRRDQMIYISSGINSNHKIGISRVEVVSIMRQRYQAILREVRQVLTQSGGLDIIAHGIVFTGQGSRVEGLSELARQVLGVSARLARPDNIFILQQDHRLKLADTSYLTAAGLLWYSQSKQRLLEHPTEDKTSMPVGVGRSLMTPWRRFVDYLKRYF